jgi:hypothetical protein
MPRIHKRKTVTNYDADKIQQYVEEVKAGKTIYSVSKEHGIPKETLRRWVVSPPGRVGSGGMTVLTAEEETLVVTAIKFLSKCGYPQDRADIKDMVQSFLNLVSRKTPFLDNRPGNDWVRLFEQRHNHAITKRTSELLTKARAEGLSRAVVDLFFDM